jgi:hypothetical protein
VKTQRQDAPCRLPLEVREEIKCDGEVVRLRTAKDEAWKRLGRDAPGLFKGHMRQYVHNETERLACLTRIKGSIDDTVKQSTAIESLQGTFNAYRAYRNHLYNVYHQRRPSHRADWFKQENANDAQYRASSDTANSETVIAIPPPPSALSKLFHPEPALATLSLELIDALKALTDPQEQERDRRMLKM